LSRHPRILITPWRRRLPTFLGAQTVLDALDPAYPGRVADGGGLPLIVSRPPNDSSPLIDELLGFADGLVLSGGGDVDPASYAAEPENVQEGDAAADAWELALLAGASQRGLPTLAICRGAQLMAVAHGGRLAQSLSETPGHRELDSLEGAAILAARHPVQLAEGSRVLRALGPGPHQVNTIHHQQIADAGDLCVTATAAGGAIEAVEPRGEWPALGVQWHPEKMDEPLQRQLFSALLHAAREFGSVTA